MQSFVDTIKKHLKKNVAAIYPASNEPVASTSAAVVPTAVVMGMSQNPVGYAPSNASNVMEGASDSNDVSGFTTAAAIVEWSYDCIAPLTVPHFFWRCSVSGPKGSFPLTLSAFIDHGLHTVLINQDFANSLSPKRRRLIEPMSIEMAMPNEGPKRVILLYEWVKLRLYDPSSFWTSKTVRAVIAPSLCAPVILGTPFLQHNNIVIDHAARTVIDKTCGFDLLNPKPPAAPKQPKKKLKEFFCDLKED